LCAAQQARARRLAGVGEMFRLGQIRAPMATKMLESIGLSADAADETLRNWKAMTNT
jgi:hypothetical protein